MMMCRDDRKQRNGVRSDYTSENGVHVHINRRGSIEIEGGHVVRDDGVVEKKSSSVSPRSRKKGFISKLEAAKELHESGLITSNDYASVKNQILSSMMKFDVKIGDGSM